MDTEKQEWRSEPQLEQLLKLPRWTLEQAEEMLQIQRRSGLSVVAFCRRVGIKQHRLYAGRRKQSQRTPLAALPEKESLPQQSRLPPDFVPLRISLPVSESTLGAACAELSHPSGVRLRFSAQIPESLARTLCSVLVSAC